MLGAAGVNILMEFLSYRLKRVVVDGQSSEWCGVSRDDDLPSLMPKMRIMNTTKMIK